LVFQQSKQTKKVENSAQNMFLVVNEPEEQEFSLQKSKFQQILGSGWRLHGIFFSFQIFLAGQQSKLTKKTRKLSWNLFSVGERARRAGIFPEKKNQQILGNMFIAEFSSVSDSFDCWPSKKSECLRKFYRSANQIPESAEILIFSKKIPALRTRSPPETCLELSF
jgi:hypothetical protein